MKQYIETILTPALQAAKKHFKDKLFTFQQDGTLSYMSKKPRSGAMTTFHVYGARRLATFHVYGAPDLNPMDFCVWSLLDADACASSYNSVEDLKVWESISLKKA